MSSYLRLPKKQRDELENLFPLNEDTMPLFRFEKSSSYPARKPKSPKTPPRPAEGF